MAIKELLTHIADFFETQKMDFAIIGAIALKAYGYSRATKDVDILTRFEYQDKVINHLESLGFETLLKTTTFSNHLHGVGALRLDFMYVTDKTADMVFSAIKYLQYDDTLRIPFVSPEHYLALKLFAVQSNPNRKFKDFADIKSLLSVVHIDEKIMREYFKKYGQEGYLNDFIG